HLLGNLKDFSPISALRMSSAEAAIWGVRNLRGWLDHGFTTVRDAGEVDAAYGQFALRDGVARGFIEGPRIFAAGGLVSLTGEHGTMLDEEGAALMERKGIWLVPTLYAFQFGAEQGEKIGLEPVMLAKVRRIISSQGPAFHRALAHRVRIAFGLDNTPDLLPREFDALVRGGLTPLQAIQTATVNAAELLGQKDALGSVEKGRYAD